MYFEVPTTQDGWKADRLCCASNGIYLPIILYLLQQLKHSQTPFKQPQSRSNRDRHRTSTRSGCFNQDLAVPGLLCLDTGSEVES